MKKMIGSGNRVLDVNLTRQEVNRLDVAEEDRRMYLGGKGLGLKYLYERLRPGLDPFDEENILAFMAGVLLGTGAPCSGRFSALTKSPLTGLILHSSCGGPFGMALKTAGYEGLLISGKSKKPITLHIDEHGATFEDAARLWGLDTRETQAALNLDKKAGALAIGPAGENRVLYANVASGHRFLGRGGMGAVMGAKNLKAVAAQGGVFAMVPHDADLFRKTCKRANRYINENDFTADLFRHYGTAGNVRLSEKHKILPVRNFTRGTHEKAMDVSGQTMKKRYRTRYSTCKPCTIRCGHEGHYKTGIHQIPEYETVGLLGTNLGIFDSDQITEWNDLCGRLGMDTISAGGTLAYVMEAGEKGLMKTRLRFGSPEGVTETLESIAHRRGAGGELADGSRRLSEKYGGKEFAVQVKGLEVAAYDPKGSWGQGLAYAVANRGGCHLSAYLVCMDVYLGLLHPFKTGAKPEFTKFFEDMTCCVNALHTCQFTQYAYTLEPAMTKYTPKPLLRFFMQYLPSLSVNLVDFSIYTDLFCSVSGVQMSNRAFLKAGERIHVLERHMNTREGISRKDDALPARFTEEEAERNPARRPVPLDEMLDRYYQIRGYDRDGIPKPETLQKLGIPTR